MSSKKTTKKSAPKPPAAKPTTVKRLRPGRRSPAIGALLTAVQTGLIDLEHEAFERGRESVYAKLKTIA